MTTAEAAASLGLATATVRRQIAEGRIAARKARRDWQVTPSEVGGYRAGHLGRPEWKTSEPATGPDRGPVALVSRSCC